MKFDELYPNAPVTRPCDPYYVPVPGFMLIKTNRNFSCDTGLGGCGKSTGWRDISFGVEFPLCSEECAAAVEKNIDTELRKERLVSAGGLQALGLGAEEEAVAAGASEPAGA